MPLCDKNPLLVDSQTVWPITAIRAGKTTLKKRREMKEIERKKRERREMEKRSKKEAR